MPLKAGVLNDVAQKYPKYVTYTNYLYCIVLYLRSLSVYKRYRSSILAYPTRFSAIFTGVRNSHLTQGGIRRLCLCDLIHVHHWARSRQNLLVLFCALLTLQSEAVYSESILFANVNIPSLNVERNSGPDHTARMRLWNNFIRFCKYRFLCCGSGDITCVSAEQRQGKSYRLHALLIETAFPYTYAALSEPVLFVRVKYQLSLPGFAKISSTPTHVDLIL